MLKVTIPSFEGFNENTNEFIKIPETTLQLEHSLVSLSKWESKWKKPFISKTEKTIEETIDYIQCMSINPIKDTSVLMHLPIEIVNEIKNYIDDSMTATTFREDSNKKSTEIITSEIIYYWMISLNIPFECQKWHLNKLLTLIRVCSIKNAPSKKMSTKEIMSRNRALNEARKAKYNSRG